MPSNAPATAPEWVDPDDAPEWSDEVLQRAALYRDGQLVEPATGTLTRRGRPPLANPKRQVTLRLDAEVLDGFRADGPGWHGRINEALRRALGV